MNSMIFCSLTILFLSTSFILSFSLSLSLFLHLSLSPFLSLYLYHSLSLTLSFSFFAFIPHVYLFQVLKKDYIIRKNQVEHTRTERSVLGYVHHPFIVGLTMAFQVLTFADITYTTIEENLIDHSILPCLCD